MAIHPLIILLFGQHLPAFPVIVSLSDTANTLRKQTFSCGSIYIQTLTTHFSKVVIKRMEPFVRKRTRTLCLCQVYNQLSRFIVSRESAATTRTEGHTQSTAQRQSLWRHFAHRSQVHQSIITFIKRLSAVFLCHPIAKLHTTESKCGTEFLRRDILAITIIATFSRPVVFKVCICLVKQSTITLLQFCVVGLYIIKSLF